MRGSRRFHQSANGGGSQQTVETYGRLDYAFNNAGIEGAAGHPVDYPEDVFDRTIAINLKEVWLCMKYEIPQMLRIGRGAQHRVDSGAGCDRRSIRLNGGKTRGSRTDVNRRARICTKEYPGKLRMSGICSYGNG